VVRSIRLILGLLLLGTVSTSSWADFSKQEVQAQFASAYQSQGLGRYEDAIKALTVVYLNYPKHYFANLKLGYAYYLNYQYANARHHYQIAHESQPSAHAPFLGLMNIALAQKDYQQVEKYGFDLLKHDLNNYYGNLKLSYALIEQHKDALAQTLISKMLAYYPEDIAFLQMQAQLYLKQDNLVAAKEVYEVILILDPNHVTAKYYLTKG
jgi:tetratricopeptide (TPR) repeat protein